MNLFAKLELFCSRKTERIEWKNNAKARRRIPIVWRRKNQEILVCAFVVCSRWVLCDVIPQKAFCLSPRHRKLKRERQSWSEVEARLKWMSFDKEDFVRSDLSSAFMQTIHRESVNLDLIYIIDVLKWFKPSKQIDYRRFSWFRVKLIKTLGKSLEKANNKF